jgi:hypothetical protein
LDATDEKKLVNCPKEDNCSLKPKQYHIWEYEQKINLINEQQHSREVEHMNNRIRFKNEEDILMRKIEKISLENNENSKIDEKLVTDLMNFYTLPVFDSTKRLISNEIIDIKDYFQFNIEKRLIQRPNELGNFLFFFYESEFKNYKKRIMFSFFRTITRT